MIFLYRIWEFKLWCLIERLYNIENVMFCDNEEYECFCVFGFVGVSECEIFFGFWFMYLRIGR